MTEPWIKIILSHYKLFSEQVPGSKYQSLDAKLFFCFNFIQLNYFYTKKKSHILEHRNLPLVPLRAAVAKTAEHK